MKIKDGFVVRNIAGSNIVVPLGENTVNFNSVITLNETGLFLWKLLEKGTDTDSLVTAVTNEYNIDAETAKKDIDAFIKKLTEAEIAK